MLTMMLSTFSALLAPRAAPHATRASVVMASVLAPAAGPALPKVGVMAVQGGFAAQLQALKRQGSVQGVEVRSAEDLEGLAALILPGGESTAQGHILSRSDMLGPVREFASKKPVWGVCAGMILLADELSGSAKQPLIGGLKVTVERNAFGRQIDSRFRSMELSDAAKESGLGDAAYFIRAPIVASVGEGVEVLATMPGDATKAAAVRQDKLLATCFHPEISSDDSWLQYFLSDVAGIAPTTAVPPPKPTTVAPWHALPETGSEVDTAIRRAFAVFQQGGVIMDVVDGEQARRRRHHHHRRHRRHHHRSHPGHRTGLWGSGTRAWGFRAWGLERGQTYIRAHARTCLEGRATVRGLQPNSKADI